MAGTEKGFTCECGEKHVYPLYVAAHWDDKLTHTCQKCKRQHTVLRGRATLIKNKGKKNDA